MALSGPRKVVKFYFVGQIPILTERSCSVTLKTLFFKNIQLELLYSFIAKFLTPAKYKCPEIYVFNCDFYVLKQSAVNRLTFISSRDIPEHVHRKPVTKRYRAEALCHYGHLTNKIKINLLAGNRERNEIEKNLILSILFSA